MLKYKKLFPDAKIISPNKGDAGYDLCSLENVVLYGSRVAKISTGIAVEIPPGHVGLIRDRSSIGAKGIVVCGGVVDSSYRNQIFVCLSNTCQTVHIVKKDDKIAQLLILPCITPPLQEVDELSQTERGEKGFGSTGR